jgi:superfamily II DNA or RNA helicase
MKKLKNNLKILRQDEMKCSLLSEMLSSPNLRSIIEKRSTPQEQGQYFEAIADIMIKFGHHPFFPNTISTHILGNVNTGEITHLHNIERYLKDEPIISGNSTGSSDITVYKNNIYYFCSCKFYTDKTKKITSYDMQVINSMAKYKKNSKYKNYEIFLCVHNKHDTFQIFDNAQTASDHIQEHLNRDISFDLNDLEKWFINFKQDVCQYKFEQYNDIYMCQKTYIKLYFHQKMIVQQSLDLIRQGEKTLLWGMKCRSGKTFIFAMLLKELKPHVTMIILAAPTETMSQFKDVFETHYDFNGFNIIVVDSNKPIKLVRTQPNIIIISKQRLQNNTDPIKCDLICFDEMHHGGTTDLSKSICEKYSTSKTILIGMTATYYKPLCMLNVSQQAQIDWGLEDEMLCQIGNLAKLHEHHPLWDISNLDLDYYKICPKLKYITNEFHIHMFKKVETTPYGFSMTTLFAIKDGHFEHESDVVIFLRYISGSARTEDFPQGDISVYRRLGSLTGKTQIWYLPLENISQISRCLRLLMLKDKVLQKYTILVFNSVDDTKNIKSKIQHAEENNSHGVIVLVGGMLTLGITLDNCDIVMLLNDTESMDKIIQMTYRCMTPRKDKEYGYVVDFSLKRIVSTMLSVCKETLPLKDKLEYVIENHLVNFDFEDFKIGTNQDFINKCIEMCLADPKNTMERLISSIDKIVLTDTDQQQLNQLMHKNSKQGSSAVVRDSEFPSGHTKKLLTTKSQQKNISFNDIIGYVLPLLAVLTMNNDDYEYDLLLEQVDEDVFNEQAEIWWKYNDSLQIIKNVSRGISKKMINTFSNILSIIKMKLRNLIDDKQAMIEYINDCLVPKKEEKDKYGEVFTPIQTIKEMLADLDTQYQKTHDHSIFTNKKLTWFDPAAGMGNFPIVLYYRLMKGLESVIPDRDKRKKHILTRMLFMSELNAKNCRICRLIFDEEINLYEGDTLKIDFNQVFGIDSFDVVFGNPPFNKEMGRSGGSPLFHLFVEQAIQVGKYVSLIIPSRYVAGGKGLDAFRKKMLARKNIVLIKQFDDAKTIFGNTVMIQGGVQQILIDSEANGKCLFINGDQRFKISLNKYDILVPNPQLYPLITKMIDFPNHITELYLPRGYYGLETTAGMKDPPGIKCFVSKQKGSIKYVLKSDIPKGKKYFPKVIIADGGHKGPSGFATMFVAEKNTVWTGTFFALKVDTMEEAESLLSFLKCRLPNFLLSLRKISQHTNKKTIEWIPLPPLNREWTDAKVYKYFKLTQDEISQVANATIVGY